MGPLQEEYTLNTIRIQKKILTLSCAVLLALPLSAAGPSFMSIYAEDEVAVEDASTAESSLSTVQDDSAQSDGSLFEDQNTNIQSRDGIPAEESGKKKSSKKMIAGYRRTGLVKSVTYDEGNKPSLQMLESQFPSTVDVYFVGESKPVTLKTSWKCAEGDYGSSSGSYFIFVPAFDEGKYIVRGMSLTADMPYIEVKKNPGVAVEMIASAPPTVNEKKVFDYCVNELGLNRAAACGILANMYCESGFRTNALGDGGTSVGVCQWHNGRWTSLRAYTSDWQTLEGQLSYMKWELEHGYSATLNALRAVSDDAQGAYDAGYFWCTHFEMPDSAHTRGITRGYLAKNVYWQRYGAEDEPDEEGCNDSFEGEYVFDGEGNLNIRAGHSEESDVIGSIKAGGKVEVTKGNGEWAHVLYEGKTGLVKMEYLTAVDTEEEDGAKRQGDAGKAETAQTAQETEGGRETEADE